MWQWSQQGARPVVMDLGSCTAFLKIGMPYLDQVRRERLHKMQILDSLELAERLLPSLEIARKQAPIAVHSVCSNLKFGWESSLLRVANACAEQVNQPHEGKCCGMGGDRGFELPGLALAATRPVREKYGKNQFCTRLYECKIVCDLAE